MLNLRQNQDWKSLPTMNSFLNEFFGENNLSKGHTYNDKKANTTENEESYGILLELPGFSKEEINIEINNDIILISSDVKKTDENYKIKEFSKSSFERSFHLPDDVNVDDIEATMENGILSITLNKIKELEIKTNTIKIDIN